MRRRATMTRAGRARMRSTRVFLLGLVAGSAMLLWGPGNMPPAWASSITSGHTFVSSPGPVDGTIDWAVFPATDAVFNAVVKANFTPGSGSPPVPDYTTGFAYLYQVANNGANTDAISLFNQSLGAPGNNSPTSPSAWGYYTLDVLVDGTTHVNAGHDLTNGTSPTIDTMALADHQKDPTSNISSVCIADPSSVSLTPANMQVTFCSPLAGGITKQTSGVLAFFSPIGPGTFSGTILNSGSATGPDPAPAPEPASVTLLASSLPVFGGLIALRRRRNGRVNAAAA
jgi:hypothetical protein